MDDDRDYAAESGDVSSSSVDKEDQLKLEEWAARLKLSVADLAVFCRNGFYYEKVPPNDTPARRMLLACLKKREIPPPKWELISGLYRDQGFTEVERRTRLRALYKALVLLIRRALARQAADPFKDERTIYWDPSAEVCRDLEIAPSKLSSFCKEFSGNSLSQVIDCVRAERVKKVMRANVREFVSQQKARCATSAAKLDAWTVWSELKKSRKWPEFTQNTWAMGFGFSTYRRMYRACVAVYGQAPHQMEMGMIQEILSAEEKVEVSETDAAEIGLEAIEEAVREIRIYSDEGRRGTE